MTSPIWLIAEREFRTYVATFSFWAALAVGPLAAGGGLLLAEGMHNAAQPVAIVVKSHDPILMHAARAALKEVASLENRQLIITQNAGARLTLTTRTENQIDLIFEPAFPLSVTARTLVARTLERDVARRASGVPLPVIRQIPSASAPAQRSNPAAVARILLMAMLWLTLTGSLGMLLQTVARERATRSLESLLAAAAPWQIMAGKLAGVGGVSFLVLGAWIGSSEALAMLAPKPNLAPALLAELTKPELLARAVMVYSLAYGLFGSATVALGALARDSASAQNLSRPMFILLMAAFFVALTIGTSGAAASPSWLLYVPVFTPFLLLTYPAGALSWSLQLKLFTLMLAATVIVARFAASRFALRESGAQFFGANVARS